jgi:hypothetical protein
MLKYSATGPSQCVDVMTNDDAMSERSSLCMTGSCQMHSDLLASNDQLFDSFMHKTNPELYDWLTVNDTVTIAHLFFAKQAGPFIVWSNSVINILKTISFLHVVQQPPVGRGLLIHEVSRSDSTTHHSR